MSWVCADQGNPASYCLTHISTSPLSIGTCKRQIVSLPAAALQTCKRGRTVTGCWAWAAAGCGGGVGGLLYGAGAAAACTEARYRMHAQVRHKGTNKMNAPCLLMPLYQTYHSLRQLLVVVTKCT